MELATRMSYVIQSNLCPTSKSNKNEMPITCKYKTKDGSMGVLEKPKANEQYEDRHPCKQKTKYKKKIKFCHGRGYSRSYPNNRQNI